MTSALMTERLTMRRWRPGDREPFARMNADPQVMRYLPRPLNHTDSDAFVERIEASFDELGFGLWALELRSTGAFIGYTGLALQTRLARRSCPRSSPSPRGAMHRRGR